MAETRFWGFDFSKKTYALAGTSPQTAKTQETSLNNDWSLLKSENCAQTAEYLNWILTVVSDLDSSLQATVYGRVFLKFPLSGVKNHFTRLTNPNHLEKIHSRKTITSQKMRIGKLLWVIPVLKRFRSRSDNNFRHPSLGARKSYPENPRVPTKGCTSCGKKADRIEVSWRYVWFLSLYVLRGEKRMPSQKQGKENRERKSETICRDLSGKPILWWPQNPDQVQNKDAWKVLRGQRWEGLKIKTDETKKKIYSKFV